jgi:hypothetical protein
MQRANKDSSKSTESEEYFDAQDERQDEQDVRFSAAAEPFFPKNEDVDKDLEDPVVFSNLYNY